MAGKRIRRIIPAAAGAAGLAVPACAAVCPKGIGDCPYPGRCFLYVDSNGDSICDYTPGDTSQVATYATAGNRSAADTQSTVSPSGGPESSTESGLNQCPDPFSINYSRLFLYQQDKPDKTDPRELESSQARNAFPNISRNGRPSRNRPVLSAAPGGSLPQW